MTRNRHGVSFTLTIVVTGVILLMTALSIITLGGSSIQSFFNTLTGEQEEAVTQAEVREACSSRAREINDNYCDMYVSSCDDTDPSSTRTPDKTQTRSERGCTIPSGQDTTVTIQGDEYDCQAQNYIGDRCPA